MGASPAGVTGDAIENLSADKIGKQAARLAMRSCLKKGLWILTTTR